MSDLPGYDDWKTTEPEEPLDEDSECICTTRRRHRWCPIHGQDPDDERDKRLEGAMTEAEKRCSRCELVKPASAFWRHPQTYSPNGAVHDRAGLQRWCRDCMNEWRRARNAVKPRRYVRFSKYETA